MNLALVASIASTQPLTLVPPRLDATASDDALLAAIAAGDRVAFGILYTRYSDAVRKAAVGALPKHDEPSADDVTQEVFLALLEGRTGYQSERGKALPWLKGIARREAARHTPPPVALCPPPRAGARAHKNGGDL